VVGRDGSFSGRDAAETPTNDYDVGQIRIHAGEALAQCCQILLQPAIE
jgi:hypothetical protein